MKSVITKLEARTDDMTLGRIPYDVEIMGRSIGGLVVRKLPKLAADTQDLVEIHVPVSEGKLALPFPTLDGIARAVAPTARVMTRSKNGPSRRMLYAV